MKQMLSRFYLAAGNLNELATSQSICIGNQQQIIG